HSPPLVLVCQRTGVVDAFDASLPRDGVRWPQLSTLAAVSIHSAARPVAHLPRTAILTHVATRSEGVNAHARTTDPTAPSQAAVDGCAGHRRGPVAGRVRGARCQGDRIVLAHQPGLVRGPRPGGGHR